MSKTTKSYMVALNAINRSIPGAEKVAGQPMPVEEIKAGSIFEPEDDDQRTELLAHGAAREATKDEATIEDKRRERAGEDAAEPSTIVASVTGGRRRGGKPKAEKAEGADPSKAGGDPLL